METCDAYDPIFEVQCTLEKTNPPHELHVNDDDSGWKVSWNGEPESPFLTQTTE